MEGAAALAGMREDVGGFLQKLLQLLVENLKVSETPRPAPPSPPSPLSWLLPRLSHVTTDVFSKSLWLWRRKEHTHCFFFILILFLSQKPWMVRWHVAFRTSHVHQTAGNNDQITDDYNWPICHAKMQCFWPKKKTKKRMKAEKEVGKSEERGREGMGSK